MPKGSMISKAFAALLSLAIWFAAPSAFAQADGDPECIELTDCPAQMVCLEGVCEPLTPGTCYKPEDCPGENEYCDLEKNTCRMHCEAHADCTEREYCNSETGDCTDLPDGAVRCDSHEGCPAGFYCQGICTVLEEGRCRRNDDCIDSVSGERDPNQYCDTHKAICRYYCSDDNQCIPDEEFCDKESYTCEPLPLGDQDSDDGFCLNDRDCSVDEYCDTDAHLCRLKCGSDADCARGEACMNRRCTPTTPGDEDTPWGGGDPDPDEDAFEIPGDTDRGDGAESDSPPISDGDYSENGEQPPATSGGGGGCAQSGGGSVFGLLMLLGALGRRRRMA